MFDSNRTDAGDSFEEKLAKLRLKIDSLPAHQRPHLYELAEAVERQHQRFHQRSVITHGAE